MNNIESDMAAAELCGIHEPYEGVCGGNSVHNEVRYLVHKFGQAHPTEYVFTLSNPADLMQTVIALGENWGCRIYKIYQVGWDFYFSYRPDVSAKMQPTFYADTRKTKRCGLTYEQAVRAAVMEVSK